MSEAVAPRCSVKKVFLEISQNSQENTCARDFWQVCHKYRYPTTVWYLRYFVFCMYFFFLIFSSLLTGGREADHTPSNVLKAAFHKFYLVHSWIFCLISTMTNVLEDVFTGACQLFSGSCWSNYHKFKSSTQIGHTFFC